MGKRFWTRDKLNAIKDLLSEGKSYRDTAKAMSTTESVIKWVVSTYKLHSGSRKGKMLKDRKQLSIAQRIAILKGEVIRRDKPSHFFTDEQLESWLWEKHVIKGCRVFCRDVLGVELQSYQAKMVQIMQTKPRALFCTGRQAGKDFVISVFSIWRCICNSNEKFLIVSPSQRQSTLLFERIMALIAGSIELFDSVKKSNMEVLEFTNGSKLYNLPATGHIRGYTEVTGIFMNETAHGLDEEVFAACEPMLATTNGFLHQFSSPSGCIGPFWDCYNNPIYWKMEPVYPSKFGLPSSISDCCSSPKMDLCSLRVS